MMVAWMNRESLAETAATGRAVLVAVAPAPVAQGRESGHVQQVHELRLDCDGDVVLLKIHQEGGIAAIPAAPAASTAAWKAAPTRPPGSPWTRC